MALHIPQQPQDARVVLPLVPANPPTLADISNAVKFKHDVISSASSFHANASTADDVSRAVVYEHTLAHTVAVLGPAVAPPWFAPVQQQLNCLDTNVAKIINAANGDGSVHSFATVRFNDGSDPTAAPHNLPFLASIAVIDVLSMVNAGCYLTGYGVHPLPNTVAARRRLVKISIGCRTLKVN